MLIEYANFDTAFHYLVENDSHIRPDVIQKKIKQNEILIVRDQGQIVGWLRFGYFWDIIPIMNMISIEGKHRRKGIGSQLVAFWENEMSRQDYTSVLTTTLSDEQAQNFYRKLGYIDAGALLLPDEVLEIILFKKL